MPDTTPDAHRTLTYDPNPDEVAVREAEEVEDDDGMMEVRLPIASTGEVRNEGDKPLTTAELRGMGEQVDSLTKGVFPEHGNSGAIDRGQYTQFEKLGYWADAEYQTGGAVDGEDLLMATARMPDPETLPAATGDYREALTILKEQAARGIPISASIGWRDDDAAPGGVDLMEASIVGIGADPRTNTARDESTVAVLSRAAVDAGADPEAFVRAVRETVHDTTPDDARPLGPPGDRDRFDTFDECVATLSEDDDMSREDAEQVCGAWEQASKGDRATYEVGETTVDITPPEPMVNAAREALDAKERYDDLADCGTGVGEDRARQIIEDEVGPDVIEEVAAYLTSHEEDVAGISDPPTDWGEETWTAGCGPVQYALWGGTATGTALDWAQRKANEVAEARDEELPYPNRARNLDDPAFAEGDPVMWTWQGEPVHGRVADIGEQFTVSGNTITGEEGEAVYLIHDYDEEREAFDREGTAKPESSLSESQMDLPPATEENFMSADTDPGDDQQAGTDDGSTDPDGQRAPGDIDEADVAEFVSEVYDGVDGADVEAAMSDAGAEFAGLEPDTAGWFIADVLDMTAGEVMDMMDADGDDGEEQEMDEDDEEDDDEMNANSADGDGDDLREEVEALRAEHREMREALQSGGVTINGDREEAAERAVDGLPDDADQEDIANAVADELLGDDGDGEGREADADDETDTDSTDTGGIDLRETNI